jgi:hypothetical protein
MSVHHITSYLCWSWVKNSFHVVKNSFDFSSSLLSVSKFNDQPRNQNPEGNTEFLSNRLTTLLNTWSRVTVWWSSYLLCAAHRSPPVSWPQELSRTRTSFQSPRHVRFEYSVFLGLVLWFHIRQNTSSYVSIRVYTSVYVCIRQDTGWGFLGQFSSLTSTVISGFGFLGLGLVQDGILSWRWHDVDVVMTHVSHIGL